MDIFWPSRVFNNVDLPTLGGPTRATTPDFIFSVFVMCNSFVPRDYCKPDNIASFDNDYMLIDDKSGLSC